MIPGYSPLGPGSCRVSALIENKTNANITIPARTVVCQLGLANKIPKLVYPGDDCDNDQDPEGLDETYEGLTYKQYEQYRTVSEQLDSELNDVTQSVKIEDIGPEDDIDGTDSNDTQSNDQDDGSCILDLIDLSGIKDWPEKL